MNWQIWWIESVVGKGRDMHGNSRRHDVWDICLHRYHPVSTRGYRARFSSSTSGTGSRARTATINHCMAESDVVLKMS